MYYITWYKGDPTYNCFSRRFTPALKLVKGAFQPLKGETMWYTEVVKLGQDSGGYQIVSTASSGGRATRVAPSSYWLPSA